MSKTQETVDTYNASDRDGQRKIRQRLEAAIIWQNDPEFSAEEAAEILTVVRPQMAILVHYKRWTSCNECNKTR